MGLKVKTYTITKLMITAITISLYTQLCIFVVQNFFHQSFFFRSSIFLLSLLLLVSLGFISLSLVCPLLLQFVHFCLLLQFVNFFLLQFVHFCLHPQQLPFTSLLLLLQVLPVSLLLQVPPVSLLGLLLHQLPPSPALLCHRSEALVVAFLGGGEIEHALVQSPLVNPLGKCPRFHVCL